MKLFELTNPPVKTKRVVLVFGRMNPPTIGHGKLLTKARQVAGSDELMVVPTKSQKPKTDPLTFDQKVSFLGDMFPEIAKDIVLDPDWTQIFPIVKKINQMGATHLAMVVGSDRVGQFRAMLTNPKYNNAETGEYYFEDIEIVNAGERDPDAEGAEGMSASKMRQAAIDNDLGSFTEGVPPGFSRTEEMFQAVRSGMGLTEDASREKSRFEGIIAHLEAQKGLTGPQVKKLRRAKVALSKLSNVDEDADNKDREKYVAGSKAGKFIYSGWG